LKKTKQQLHAVFLTEKSRCGILIRVIMINFEKELNQEQLDVVLHGNGPCLVLAGAGSGKTRVITYRVAYLLEQGVAPENILLLTFTNKAASEMNERIMQICGMSEKLPWAGTFHHIGHKILRAHADMLGYGKNFSVLDSDDSEALLKLAAKDYAPNGKNKKFPSAGVLQAIISLAKNTEEAIGESLDRRFENFLQFKEQINEISREYDKKKKEANAMDFDDLLINALAVLNSPNILEKYSSQFKYILVDEYQDTNKIQSSMVKRLAQKHKNILCVGDDAQSIYSFRGANIENILDFEKDFPKAKIFRLEINYRSSQEILSLANSVIANNPKQHKKNLKTIIKTGVKPELRPHGDQIEEAEFVANKIASLIRGGVDEKEISVLFRAAHHSQALELELMKQGIDYDYRGGTRFFERSHVKDVLAYLRIISNLNDSTSWFRVLVFEDGIGPASAGKIIADVKSADSIEALEKIGDSLTDKARAGWNNFYNLLLSLIDEGKTNPSGMIKKICESQYADFLKTEKTDGEQRLEDIKQLADFAKRYDNLENFLADAALQESFKLQNQKKQKEKIKDGKIVLSTIHQSKGLEWSAVFVLNLTHGAFPHERAAREEGGIEEERRLFYVAVTRAKKYLFLNYPTTSSGRGNGSNWGEPMANYPSIFISEIDNELLDDHSFLKNDYSKTTELEYVPEDKPIKIKPGSFLKNVEDL
jgi:DNA helicase-2/ATP-dependent DNA helicase PcrA